MAHVSRDQGSRASKHSRAGVVSVMSQREGPETKVKGGFLGEIQVMAGERCERMIVSSQRKTRRHGQRTDWRQARFLLFCASPLAPLPHPPLQKVEPILTPRPHWNPHPALRRKGGGLTPFGNRDMASPGMNQCLALRSLAYSLSRDPADADRFQRETTPPLLTLCLSVCS